MKTAVYFLFLALFESTLTVVAQDTIYFLRRPLLLVAVSLCPFSFLFSQTIIKLKNPSFEGVPTQGGRSYWELYGWRDCGRIYFPNESPPDIHGDSTNFWKVNIKPHDGNTYLGLVTRFDATFESVCQKLTQPLKSGHCYQVTLYVNQSPVYDSGTRRVGHGVTEEFTAPTTLRLWGGNENCARSEKLYESPAFELSEWTEYSFMIKPLMDLSYINIEAYLERENHVFPTARNGHLLIDDLSPIMEIPCR